LFDPVEERIAKAIKIIERGKPWRNSRILVYESADGVGRREGCFLFPVWMGCRGEIGLWRSILRWRPERRLVGKEDGATAGGRIR